MDLLPCLRLSGRLCAVKLAGGPTLRLTDASLAAVKKYAVADCRLKSVDEVVHNRVLAENDRRTAVRLILSSEVTSMGCRHSYA